jgi:hypothetical protein
MIIDHCYNILVNGVSPYVNSDYGVTERVFDTLKTGMNIKKLNGLKSALIMVELLKVEQVKADETELARYFTNFVQWGFATLSTPMLLAVVKYALKDRGLTTKQAVIKSAGWQRLHKDFALILLVPDAEAQKSIVYRQMMRYANRLSASTVNARSAIDGDVRKPKVVRRHKMKELAEV